MKSSCLFLLVMFMFTKNVHSKERDSKEVRKGIVVEPRYNYNHPPSAEYYNPIPVSVVYEDSNNHPGKSGTTSVSEKVNNFKERKSKFVEPRYHLNHPPSVENYNPIPVSIVYEDNAKYSGKSDISTLTEIKKIDENNSLSVIDTGKNNNTTTEHKHTSDKENVKVEAQRLDFDEFQIPVAIVYDTDSSIYQNHHKRKTDSVTESPKPRSNYSRKIETDVNNEQRITAEASHEETEKYQSKIDTRVFKKRTGGRDPVVPIVDMESYIFSHSGNFHYRYEGGDGTKAYSEGKSITMDDETGESVVGGFSYKDKEGNDFSLTYTADENGYRPVGAHLPTPPPIPPAIARALEYLATATPEPVTKRPEKPKHLVS